MTASPSSSSTVSSSRGRGEAVTSILPRHESRAVEFVERTLDVFLHDIPMHAEKLADCKDHLVGGGRAVAQIPDRQRRVVHDMHGPAVGVVEGYLVLCLTAPYTRALLRPSNQRRDAHD